MPKKKTRRDLDREIDAFLGEPTASTASTDETGETGTTTGGDRLFWPGGAGGGGRRRGSPRSAVVRPHRRTSRRCTRCGQFHTQAEHARHERRDSMIDPTKGQARRGKVPRPPARRGEAPVLELPDFQLLAKQPRIPHVARVVVREEWPNEYGTQIVYEVHQSRNKKDWWIHASLGGHQMSNTLHTSLPRKADEWVSAVRTGMIRVGPVAEVFTGATNATPVARDPAIVVRDAVAQIRGRGRVGDRKIFISAAYDRVGRELGMTLPEFKQWLLRQHLDRKIQLARADFVAAMDPDLVRDSETIYDRGAATFHFIVDPSYER